MFELSFLVVVPICIWFVSVLYSALTLKLLWAWFVVPFGVMPITMAWAVGLACMVELAKGVPASLKSHETDPAILELFKPYLGATFFLFIGYIAHLFM